MMSASSPVDYSSNFGFDTPLYNHFMLGSGDLPLAVLEILVN